MEARPCQQFLWLARSCRTPESLVTPGPLTALASPVQFLQGLEILVARSAFVEAEVCMRASRSVPVPLETATLQLPLFASPVRAGYPNPAEDYIEQAIDIQKLLIQRPASTFLLKVSGSSMKEAGIFHNDLVIVDRSLSPREGDVVIARVEDGHVIKHYQTADGVVLLSPANPEYEAIRVTPDTDASIIGVVCWVLHRPPRRRS